MKDEDRELIEKVFFPMWNKWTGGLTEDVNEMMRYFAQRYGVKEKSPMSLMFVAFCAGVDMGVELDWKMNSEAESTRSGTQKRKEVATNEQNSSSKGF